MIVKETFDLALSLYKIGVKNDEEDIKRYVEIYEDNPNHYIFKIENKNLEQKLGNITRKKHNNERIECKNVYKVEHIFGILKKMIIDYKRGMM